jgi:uncharacterized protein YneF (UPF0154 family)
MQDEPPITEHPLSTLGLGSDPNPYTYLVIGLIVGIFIGVAIMKVRADQKRRGE